MDDSTVGINPALLAPNTDYSVTIDPSLADTFGQTLGTAAQATFRTTDMKATVWAPNGTNLFPASAKVALNVSAVNVPDGAAGARFVALGPGDIVRNDNPSGDDSAVFSLPAARRIPLATAGAPNVERTLGIPLRDQLGGPAGVLAYTVASSVPKGTTYTGLVQLTNLGVFAQWFPDSGFVRVDRLSDGSPAGGVQVAIYRSQTSDKTKGDAIPCATGQTGADGIARFDGDGFAACAALDKGANAAPSFVTIVRDGGDWTYVRTDDTSGAYSSNLYTGWSSATPIARSTIFSDRDLYQPGETAQLTAVRMVSHPRCARARQSRQLLGRAAISESGEAHAAAVDAERLRHRLDPDRARQERAAGATITSTQVPVTARRSTAVSASRNSSRRISAWRWRCRRRRRSRGQSLAASTTSTYLFGSPVAGASTAYNVTRSLTNYTWTRTRASRSAASGFGPKSSHRSVPTCCKRRSRSTRRAWRRRPCRWLPTCRTR